MWLLNAATYELELFEGAFRPRYAILSHRWGEDELTFKDVVKKRYNDKKGFGKVAACCREALSDDLQYVWVDTCCIDKRSSAELSEAINSMYDWYAKSVICYAYLSDVQLHATAGPVNLNESVWFSRGWTLQELLAPTTVYFYDNEWNCLGSKASHAEQIQKRTGIPETALRSFHPRDWSVMEKMSWFSDRETTRIEDRAYSLLGVLEVNMPLLYGEGRNAFMRLQQIITASSTDLSLFGWTRSPDEDSNLLAESAQSYSKTLRAAWLGAPRGKLPQTISISDTSYGSFQACRAQYTLTKEGIQGDLGLRHHMFNIYTLNVGVITSEEVDTNRDAEMANVRSFRICIFLEHDGVNDTYRRVMFEGENCIAFAIFAHVDSQRRTIKCHIKNEPLHAVSGESFTFDQWKRFLALNPMDDSLSFKYVWAGTKWALLDNVIPDLFLPDTLNILHFWSTYQIECLVLFPCTAEDFWHTIGGCVVISFQYERADAIRVLFTFAKLNESQLNSSSNKMGSETRWRLKDAPSVVVVNPTRGGVYKMLRQALKPLQNAQQRSKALEGRALPQKPKTEMFHIELGNTRPREDVDHLQLTVSELGQDMLPNTTVRTTELLLEFNCYIPGIEAIPDKWLTFPGLNLRPPVTVLDKGDYTGVSWPAYSAFFKYLEELLHDESD